MSNRTFALALGLLAMMSATARPAVEVCEPADETTALTQAMADAKAGNFDAATQRVLGLPKADRENLNGQAVSALILLYQHKTDPALYKSAVASLATVANKVPDYGRLPPATQRCAETRKLYLIFNTLGVEYLTSNDYRDAERYFLRGEANKNALAKEDLAKLYNNMALLYQNQLNLAKAGVYFQKARDLNVNAAQAQTRVDAIRQIQGLAKSR